MVYFQKGRSTRLGKFGALLQHPYFTQDYQEAVLVDFYVLIPLVNIYFAIKITIHLAKAFGQSSSFVLGLIFLGFVYYPLLTFNKRIQYEYGETDEIDSIGQ